MRAEPRQQPPPLRVVERLGREPVKARLDARCRDVGVLAARSGGAARANGQLAERDRELVVDAKRGPRRRLLIAHRRRAPSLGRRLARVAEIVDRSDALLLALGHAPVATDVALLAAGTD